jgi:hypothetical protein
MFSALPHDALPLSAGVDFLHMIACGKPAVRFKVSEYGSTSIARWSAANGYACRVDEAGFCCVAPTSLLAEHVLEVDRRSEPHEMELGLLLGYPRCCCEAVAAVGESAIDDHAAIVAAWPFAGRFQSINPAEYRKGTSLICHLPCSPKCAPSLEIASRAAGFLRGRLKRVPFDRWSCWAALR